MLEQDITYNNGLDWIFRLMVLWGDITLCRSVVQTLCCATICRFKIRLDEYCRVQKMDHLYVYYGIIIYSV